MATDEKLTDVFAFNDQSFINIFVDFKMFFGKMVVQDINHAKNIDDVFICHRIAAGDKYKYLSHALNYYQSRKHQTQS